MANTLAVISESIIPSNTLTDCHSEQLVHLINGLTDQHTDRLSLVSHWSNYLTNRLSLVSHWSNHLTNTLTDCLS